MSVPKTVLVNIGILLFLLGAALIGPIVLSSTYYQFARLINPGKVALAALPNYQGEKWPVVHFEEFSRLGTASYRDFVVWRHEKFKGQTINIDVDGLRHTDNSNAKSDARSVWFAGGSTMWGTGSSDDKTIPSYFARRTGSNALNIAESGYVARQSLNMLLDMLQHQDHEVPDVVVFYDGVNDVVSKCRRDSSHLSTARESEIRAKLKAADPLSFRYLLQTPLELLRRGRMKLFVDSDRLYDCDDNSQKALAIANSLVDDWSAVAAIAHQKEFQFIPILQPVSYFSATKLDRIKKSEELEKQFLAVYPLIKSAATASNLNFLDFTSLFDRDEYIYIDFCHVSPTGSELVADQLAQLMSAGPSIQSNTKSKQ